MRKKWGNRIGAIVLACALTMNGLPVQSISASTQKAYAAAKSETGKQDVSQPETKMGNVVLDGNDIAVNNVNGLTYKGFGMLSGNSTSDLLMDYKAEQPKAYAELMQYLFGGNYPIMNHVKLEMGNDRNTSTGPESCTKRTEKEKANVLRNPGWQLAADARKINPKIKVSILRWEAPVWAGTDEKIYQWYKETILDAYEKYGYMVDYINPNINEKWDVDSDVAFTKKFAKWIAAETKETIPDEKALALYHKIKLVVSDESGTASDSVVESMKSDSDFYNSVDVVGYHYSPWDDSNGGMKWLAQTKDKEVWNSEAQATFSNSAFRLANNVKDPTTEGTGLGGTGSALEMANTFIKGFVQSRRSHVIYQPAIGSFYEGAQFSFKELVSARDPWSGWIHYDAGLLMLAHISKFAVTGWENEDNTAGIWRAVPQASKCTADGTNPVNGRNGGENYMTLASPAKDNFSTMIVNDSEYPMEYKIQTKDMKLAGDQNLEIWETRAADDGAFNENYMKCIGTTKADDNGVYTVKVNPYSAVTVTTLQVAGDEEHTKALPVEGERTVLDTDRTGSKQDVDSDYLYADDFEYAGKTVPVLDGKGGFTGETEDYIQSRGGDTGAMARYTHTMNGAFEVYKTQSGDHVLRQQTDFIETGVGGSWNSGAPVTLIGDLRWTNYKASVDVLFEREDVKNYAAVAIREMGGSHNITSASGYTFKLYPDGKWELYRKAKKVVTGTCDAKTQFDAGANQWNTITLEGKGNTINAYVNYTLVGSYIDEQPITAGRIALGSSNAYTQFDNLEVKKLDGYVPYYTELLDNMEQYDLSAQKNTKLEYNDKWLHTNGQGMYVYQRSVSKNTDNGATLTYTFTGTGLEILGEMKKTCTVQMTVDGNQHAKQETQKSANMNMTVAVTDLVYGKHVVTVEVLDGTMAVDMVGILGAKHAQKEPDVQPTKRPNVKPTQTPSVQPTVKPTAAPQQTPKADRPNSPKKGTKVNKNIGVYQVTKAATMKKAGTVKLSGLNKKYKKAAALVIPDKITIGAYQYRVTAIGTKACQGIKASKVTLGKNVKEIGKYAFQKAKKLKTFVVKGKLTKVSQNAYKGCKHKIKLKGSTAAVRRANLKKLKKSGYKKFSR